MRILLFLACIAAAGIGRQALAEGQIVAFAICGVVFVAAAVKLTSRRKTS